MRNVHATAVLLALTGLVPRVRADELHYRNVPVGDRALGMGGAFTAIADDPSAAYYNPAGLALIEQSSVAASLQVNSIDRRTVDDAYGGVGNQRADFRHDAGPSVPIFVSLLKKVGPRDPEGRQRHAIGLSTFHPDRRTLEYTVAVNALDEFNPDIRIFEDFRLRHEDTTAWFGPSYAFAPTDGLAFGISAFLSNRTLRHDESLTQVDANAVAANTADTSYFTVQDAFLRLTARHLVLRLGAMLAASRHVQVGVMFQPPGIALSESGTITGSVLYADNSGLPPQFARTSQKVSASSPIPWELRVGVAYRTDAADLKLGLDLSLHGPSGSANDPIQTLGFPREDPMFVGYSPWLGDYFSMTSQRQLTFNVAVGGEVTIADVIPVRAGLFTNRSAAPKVPAAAFAYQAEDIDLYGGSVSIGLRTGDYDLSIGGALMFGSGDALRKLPSGETASEPGASYARTSVTDTTLIFFLTGYRKALSRAARAAYNEVRAIASEPASELEAAADEAESAPAPSVPPPAAGPPPAAVPPPAAAPAMPEAPPGAPVWEASDGN